LEWNVESLRRAEAVADERVTAFFPSIYSNLGYSFLRLGRRDEARAAYEEAARRFSVLSDGPYGDQIREEVTARLAELRRDGRAI
jgi:hypothetical protein